MTEPLFHVIATGRPAPGSDAAAVALRLQRQLTAVQAARLLGGSPVIAKRGVARTIAEQYCARLGALGLDVYIEAAASATADPASPPPQAADPALDDLFRDATTPAPGRGPRYRLAVVRAAAELATLVAGYGGLVALGLLAQVAWTIAFHGLLTAPPLLFSVPVFLVPWLLLLTLNIVLLRPLLPLQPAIDAHAPLQKERQPQLFRWLSQLCTLVAAPPPRDVVLDTGIEHAVHGVAARGALLRGDYRLALSLPLLEAATLRDNTALLAALLATQARPADVRCRFVLRTVGARLAACLDQRDWLATRIGGRSAQPMRKLLALHAPLLIAFMKRCDGIQQRLARAAVGEADRVYAHLAGSAGFIDCLLVQHALGQAARDAAALNDGSRAGGLAADLPALIHHYVDHFDAAAAARLRRQWSEVVRRSPRDALPSAAERCEAVQALAVPGLLGNAAATGLLLDRDRLAQDATRASYTQAGIAFEPAQLAPVETLTFAATEDLLQREQTAQYFNNWFAPFRCWRMTEHALVRAMPTADAVQQLNVCVNEIRRLTPDRVRLLQEYERLLGQLQDLLVGQHVVAQGQPYAFRYIAYDGGALQPLIEECQARLARVMEQLATQETIMGGRISLALRLCGESQRDAERLHRALLLFGGLDSRLYRLALDVHQLEQLVQLHYDQRDARYALPIRRLEEKIDGACLLLHERLKEIPWPLDTRHATVADFIAAQASCGHGRSAALDRAAQLLQQLRRCNEALSRSAAGFGTIAEEAYGIERIRLLPVA